MGVEYRINDTAHYRYFKSRLHEYRKELILKENESKFHIIRRRINADDFESLSTYYNNMRTLLKKLFFILTYIDDPPYAEYRELYCVESEDALWEYLHYNYDIEKTNKTVKKLKNGYTYKNEMRQGVG